jgi:threonylcarbamoyladenosine tRNA methylthiotransferase MtaB
MRKAALHNLGCKVNAYETEAMQQLLEAAGYEIVPFSETADVYVINTCSVTNMADRKSRQMLHRAKKQNPEAVVVAAGCYVQTKEEEAMLDPAIDIILGNNKKNELVGLLEEFFRLQNKEEQQWETDAEASAGAQHAAGTGRFHSTEPESKICEMTDLNDASQSFEELSLTRTAEHTRAFIKVQDGCNQFCSYCIIPYARGRVRSRDFGSVIREVQILADQGYKEIVLTGIHLSSYGVDCGDSLIHLIRGVHAVDGVERIRLGSLEPRLITEEFVRELSGMDKICPHFHLSLQSGCDATLKRMNRKYTAEEYEKSCVLLRTFFDHPAITTDVIVGFPGETEEEFAETKAFLEHIHFYEMHIFKYSKRKGTRAAVMDNQIPEGTKTERSAKLIQIGEHMSKEYRKRCLDTEQEVLFEEQIDINGTPMYVGYTKEYVRVAAASGESLVNRIVRGRITGMLTDELMLMEV